MSSGRPDDSFGGGDGTVVMSRPRFYSTEWMASAVSVQPDGKILVAGGVRPALGPESEGGCHSYFTVLAQLRSDGGIEWINDDEVGDRAPLLSGIIKAIEMQGRKILVGGIDQCGYEQGDRGFLSRVNPDGRVDETFADSGRTTLPSVEGGSGRSRFAPFSDVNALLVVPDGPIYAAGSVRYGLMLARLSKNGRLDRRFAGDGIVRGRRGPRAIWQGLGLARDRRGRLLVSGSTHSRAFALARYLPAGRLDRSFGQGGIVRKRSLATDSGGGVAVMPDGRIVVAGISSHRGQIGPWGKNLFLTLLRYRPSGRLDPLFFGDGVFTRPYTRSWAGATSWDLTIGRRGRILVTGAGTAMRFRPAR
jgi:uncharacterized delta-60 repeat protein